MSDTNLLKPIQAPRRKSQAIAGKKLRDADKVELIPITPEKREYIRKPDWIKITLPAKNSNIERIKKILREKKLSSVCEEASCPNLSECFSHGTATFMIMGDVCTRRCPFCDVGHGKPNILDIGEPLRLAEAIAEMQLKYVVITSVDRDDLLDGGSEHFTQCIKEVRRVSPKTKIEILTPDFRGRMDIALTHLTDTPPDVFNHNLETVPSLYLKARPGADYAWSLKLLKKYKELNPTIPTKSGLMVGMGEEIEELYAVLRDMREHNIDMLTIGQYLQPSRDHYPVHRYMHPDEFKQLEEYAYSIGFKQVASGPLVRSSYHADKQAAGEAIESLRIM